MPGGHFLLCTANFNPAPGWTASTRWACLWMAPTIPASWTALACAWVVAVAVLSMWVTASAADSHLGPSLTWCPSALPAAGTFTCWTLACARELVVLCVGCSCAGHRRFLGRACTLVTRSPRPPCLQHSPGVCGPRGREREPHQRRCGGLCGCQVRVVGVFPASQPAQQVVYPLLRICRLIPQLPWLQPCGGYSRQH